MVITDTLKQIANHLGIEKAYWHFHQLDQEVGYDADINTCTDVKKYPRPNEINRHPADEKHHLGCKDQVYEIDVLGIDPHIDNTLCQKRKDKLNQASDQESQYQLNNQFPVRLKVFEQKTEITPV